ncbi:glycerophosphodiester phosphodiesterase domain-containing protein 1 [Stylonychia lemnae]|uniref:Glycerophosphodiester phosphodiesterase domain-containing protein 1 n=1 Tax=Stylonychia lemnae TaxID=5949 RepID=A0A077ZV79_STYLE|nr:glycerophosphodiester phosphodiesterase domain-containing protein 1 [Stylonychia lemnae]|eukprot:CDW73210.1 glycerophosphodiester phosphodiesterase domain-containing protein 1 [Stylonychia lemnae]
MLAFIVPVLGLYYGIQYIFLLHPSWLRHKKKTKLQLPAPPTKLKKYVHSHRAGGSYEKPESTLNAFKHSAQIGALVETDVQMTKDGVLVAFHDDDLIRTCGVDKKISETDYADLPQLRSPIPIWFSYGDQYFFKPEDEGHSQIPSLTEVFEALPATTIIMLELKNAADQNARKQLVELIKKHDRQSTTIVGTGQSAYNRLLSGLDENLPIFMPELKVIKYFLYYLVGILAYVKIEEDVASLPYMSRQYASAKWRQEKSVKTFFYIPITWIMSHLCDAMIVNFNERGIYTNYYVANEESDIKNAFKRSSIQGVMTDKPSLALEVLNKLSDELK